MTFTFSCESAYINPSSSRLINVELVFDEKELDTEEIAKEIPTNTVVEAIGWDVLLEHIGKEKAMEYFNLQEQE